MDIYNHIIQETQSYEILGEFPFDSDRKRMSLLVKRVEDEQYILMVKGADNVMIHRLALNSDSHQLMIDSDVKKFANEGLRTLTIAQKLLSKEQALSILEDYEILNLSTKKTRAVDLTNFFEGHEQQLQFLGLTAIEDKLQDGVPDTIANLIAANIRVWVLTGDKLETAIEIGKSCNLI